MRRLAATLVALAVVASVAAVSAVGAGVPPFPKLPGAWSHAEINVKIRGVPHTLILDRGRIIQASPSGIVLRELDGSTVTVPLSPQTIVRINGVRRSVDVLQPRLRADTMRIDGGPAVLVRAVGRLSLKNVGNGSTRRGRAVSR